MGGEDIVCKDVFEGGVRGDKLGEDMFEYRGGILGEGLGDLIGLWRGEGIMVFGGLGK